jgi:L-ascorbate metabolism protein UlaG (beta-lactamase superfamily)
MELTWWGTASFRLETRDETILIDPYLSRSPDSRPVISMKPEDVEKADRILITHGHFDHIMDIPIIASRTGAIIYSDPVAGETMIDNGLDPAQWRSVTEDGQLFDFGAVEAKAFHSKHVKFDRLLLLKMLLRSNYRLFGIYKDVLKGYPPGQVLSWRLTVEGKTLHLFGSGGAGSDELERDEFRPTDVLLVPLQGHTDICNIALKYVKAIRPAIVIPHHQDNFYPPISTMVDIEPFLEGVRRECPDTEIKVLTPDEPWTF